MQRLKPYISKLRQNCLNEINLKLPAMHKIGENSPQILIPTQHVN